jgi:hypothetical protein
MMIMLCVFHLLEVRRAGQPNSIGPSAPVDAHCHNLPVNVLVGSSTESLGSPKSTMASYHTKTQSSLLQKLPKAAAKKRLLAMPD